MKCKQAKGFLYLKTTFFPLNKSSILVEFRKVMDFGGPLNLRARWWFQIFFIFSPKIGEDEPILTSIFSKWVGSTTNQRAFSGKKMAHLEPHFPNVDFFYLNWGNGIEEIWCLEPALLVFFFGLEILGFGNQNVGISNLMTQGDSDCIPYTINPENNNKTNENQPFEDVFPIEKWWFSSQWC